jgi:hypothetical protein
VQELISILGYPMLHETARELLQKNGFEPTYSKAELRRTGSVHLGPTEHGVTLDFSNRLDFQADFAEPQAEGDAIFTCIFVDINDASDFSSFAFPKALDIKGCNVRDEALKRFGVPEVTRTDDGIVEWDRWIIREGLSIRAEYRDDQSIYMWTIGVPMKLDPTLHGHAQH